MKVVHKRAFCCDEGCITTACGIFIRPEETKKSWNEATCKNCLKKKPKGKKREGRQMKDIYQEFYELKKENEVLLQALGDINSILYCIGGPLNDNVLLYTPKQLKTFWEISKISEGWSKDS